MINKKNMRQNKNKSKYIKYNMIIIIKMYIHNKQFMKELQILKVNYYIYMLIVIK